MKSLLWMPALALCTVVCLTACDESSSGNNSADIPTYVDAASLPDSCEMAAAKVDSVYYACFENEWIEVVDSATIEKIKEGLDEEDLKKELQDLQEVLSSAAAQKANNASSSSAAVADEGKNENEDGGIESSSEEAGEESGDSSSSEKNSGKGGDDKGDGSSSSDEKTGDSSSSEGDGDSSSSEGGVVSSSSAKAESKCGTVVYDPETQVCEEDDVVKGKCGTVTYDLDGTKTCEGDVIKGVCGTVTYDLDGTKTCEGNVVKGVCGSKTYDLQTEACVNNVVKGKCGSQTYDLNGTRTCENGEVKGLCGSVVYDLDGRLTCEGGKLMGVCNGKPYNLTNETCVNNVIKGLCDSQTYDKATQGCCGATVYNLNARVCSETNQLLDYCGDPSLYHLYNKNTQVCRTRDAAVIDKANAVECGSEYYNEENEFCDNRSGVNQSYKFVKIFVYGTQQTWMAENLRYNASGSRCFNNVSSNCDKYGRLYSWSTASSYNGICPTGWHLPSETDYNNLIRSLNRDTTGSNNTGSYLKAAGAGWTGGTTFDTRGFSALPAGYSTGSYSYGLGEMTCFWSGTSNKCMLLNGTDQASLTDMTGYYVSVRCIKNE